MTATRLDESSIAINPIEQVEEVLISRELPFDRPLDDEIIAELSSGWCNFRLWLSWEPLCDVFMLTCAYDTKVPEARRDRVYPLLAQINERMVMGHFEISSDDGTLFYRYGQLVKDSKTLSADVVDELIDVANCECERFYPVFQTALWSPQSTDDAIKLALLQPVGEA